MVALRRIFDNRALAVGLAAVMLAFAWQFLTVHYNYGGNWSGLFCTGATQRVPHAALPENIYALPGKAGYDGQFYHYIAHDPLGRRGLAEFVDAPRLRYGRILVPALAYMLAAGQARWVDAAYFAVMLWFIYLGAYWLSRFVALHQHHPAFGLLFLAAPAVPVSIDRMTVDIALAAFWIGALVYWTQGNQRRLFVLLALAPLVRETGLVLGAAYCLWAVRQQAFAKAALAATVSAVPFLAWLAYTRSTFPPYYAGWLVTRPFGGLIDVAARAISQVRATPLAGLASCVHLLALAGSLLAVVLAVRSVLAPPASLMEAGIAASGVLGVMTAVLCSIDVWGHVFGYSRLLAPLLMLLALRGWQRCSWSDLTPIACILPSVGAQFAGDGGRVLRGLISRLAG